MWGILKNPAYKGSAAFGKTRIGERRLRLRAYRGQAEQPRRAYSVYDVPAEEWISIPVPPIVEEELFDAVAEQLVENRARNRQTKRGVRYLLQGLLVCRCCGHAYYGKPLSLSSRKGKYRHYAYYRCIGMDAYRFGGQRICENRQVRTDMIEEAVWSDVRALLQEPERIEQEYEQRLKDDGKQARSCSDQQLAALIQRVQRGIARLIDAYEEGLLERTEFEPRIKTAKSRLEKLQGEAQALAEDRVQEQQLRLVIGQLQEFAGRVRDGVQQADWTTRRELIRTLVKRVEIEKEDVRIVYRLSPPSQPKPPDGAIMQHCRRGAVAALGEPAAGRLGQGIGTSGPLLLPLRG
ncbi:MAG: recombinase zinc beta ribbon domain-containing protein [Candidatus Methylomirabilis sp.]